MRIVIIVQARMGSTRLPGKVLKEVLGRTLLEYQVERLRRVKGCDEIVLATTTDQRDDVLVELCSAWSLACFRGEEEDVLDRYFQAAREFKADAVVRVTSDCPLIDPEVIGNLIRVFHQGQPGLDYVSNTLERTFPRGMDAEVFTTQALEAAWKSATGPDREHVTRYIYRHPERFRLEGIKYKSDQSAHRWTVDTPEDFELIRRIIEALYPNRP